MAKSKKFQHLSLPYLQKGKANITGGGDSGQRTKDNKTNRVQHSQTIAGQVTGVSASWQQRLNDRPADAPEIPVGIPLVLEIDPELDIDDLRYYFDFEIVLEDDDGFVIVASQDLELAQFEQLVQDFVNKKVGTATIASIYGLDQDDDQERRLQKILSESLYQRWPEIVGDNLFIVDIGIECTGTKEIPKQLNRWKRDTDQSWARRQEEWSAARLSAYDEWTILWSVEKLTYEGLSKVTKVKSCRL